MRVLGNNKSDFEKEFHIQMSSFFEAIKKRDYINFRKFFREDIAFIAYLPGGKIIEGASAFLAQQQSSWFAVSTGSFNYNLIETAVFGDLGLARLNVNYKNIDPQGKPFELEIYISSIFRKIDNQWFNVHVQNSVLN